MSTRERLALAELEPTLPSHYYYDPAHHEREMDAFWFRHWICVGSTQKLANPGDFIVVAIGDQSIVITRDEARNLHAFHNTCRHRGSVLCEASDGHFRNNCIVCPYHAWTYGLNGELQRTPRRLPSDDFRFENFPLYRVGVIEWAGFAFINLATQDNARPEDALQGMPALFSNWRLETASIGHTLSIDLACNWKVFWENFDECYHCPGVHPELCRVVPLYANGWVSVSDNPDWQPPEDGDSSDEPRLAPGARTWSMDGNAVAHEFSDLDPRERQAGHTYGVSMPSCFLVGHVDYARLVRLAPLGPESTRLNVDWLFNPQTMADESIDIERIVALGKLVVEQDGKACELNQRGLRSRRHSAGVLVGQEYYLSHFHHWIRQTLAAD